MTEKVRDRLDIWEVREPVSVQDIRAKLAFLEGRPGEALRLTRGHAGLIGQIIRPLAAILASRKDLIREFNSRDPGEFREGFIRGVAHWYRGTTQAYWGEFEQAVQSFRDAAAATAERRHEGYGGGMKATSLHALARLLSLRGNLAGARAAVDRALAVQPESPRCLYYAGLGAVRQGGGSAAERYLQRLVEVLSVARSRSAYLYRDGLEAEMALAQGRPEEARDLSEEIMSSGKVSWDWYAYFTSSATAFRDGLIRTYLTLGEKEKAAELMADLLASGFERLDYPANYVLSLYNLGVIKLESGETEEGRELLK